MDESSASPSPMETGFKSPYAEAEFKAADHMRIIRGYVSQLDAIGTASDGVQAARTELMDRIRQEENDLRRVMQDAKRTSLKENRTRQYNILRSHYTKTQQLVRSRYNAGNLASGAGQGHSAFIGAGVDLDAGEPGYGEGAAAATSYNLHEDAEFAQFFEQTKERDVDIDEHLDRIHAGVQRLRNNAEDIHQELRIQESVLDDVEQRVDQNQQDVATMNVKLRKAIKKLGKSRLITYAVLCVILVVLIIVIAFLAKAF